MLLSGFKVSLQPFLVCSPAFPLEEELEEPEEKALWSIGHCACFDLGIGGGAGLLLCIGHCGDGRAGDEEEEEEEEEAEARFEEDGSGRRAAACWAAKRSARRAATAAWLLCLYETGPFS